MPLWIVLTLISFVTSLSTSDGLPPPAPFNGARIVLAASPSAAQGLSYAWTVGSPTSADAFASSLTPSSAPFSSFSGSTLTLDLRTQGLYPIRLNATLTTPLHPASGSGSQSESISIDVALLLADLRGTGALAFQPTSSPTVTATGSLRLRVPSTTGAGPAATGPGPDSHADQDPQGSGATGDITAQLVGALPAGSNERIIYNAFGPGTYLELRAIGPVHVQGPTVRVGIPSDSDSPAIQLLLSRRLVAEGGSVTLTVIASDPSVPQAVARTSPSPTSSFELGPSNSSSSPPPQPQPPTSSLLDRLRNVGTVRGFGGSPSPGASPVPDVDTSATGAEAAGPSVLFLVSLRASTVPEDDATLFLLVGRSHPDQESGSGGDARWMAHTTLTLPRSGIYFIKVLQQAEVGAPRVTLAETTVVATSFYVVGFN